MSTTNYLKNKTSFGQEGYGYLWWLDNIAGLKTYSAIGKGGQFIINIPQLNMTIVTTAIQNVEKRLGRYDNPTFIHKQIVGIVSLITESER